MQSTTTTIVTAAPAQQDLFIQHGAAAPAAQDAIVVVAAAPSCEDEAPTTTVTLSTSINVEIPVKMVVVDGQLCQVVPVSQELQQQLLGQPGSSHGVVTVAPTFVPRRVPVKKTIAKKRATTTTKAKVPPLVLRTVCTFISEVNPLGAGSGCTTLCKRGNTVCAKHRAHSANLQSTRRLALFSTRSRDKKDWGNPGSGEFVFAQPPSRASAKKLQRVISTVGDITLFYRTHPTMAFTKYTVQAVTDVSAKSTGATPVATAAGAEQAESSTEDVTAWLKFKLTLGEGETVEHEGTGYKRHALMQWDPIAYTPATLNSAVIGNGVYYGK